jgi:hypothetical protein
MSNTMEIPDLPEEKAEKVQKNWKVYLFFGLVSLLSSVITNYWDGQRSKPTQDMNIYLLKKLDSTESDNIKYLREIIEERKK